MVDSGSRRLLPASAWIALTAVVLIGLARPAAVSAPVMPRPDHSADAAVPPAGDRGRARSPATGNEIVAVRPGHTVRLRSRPGGRVLVRVAARTEFGSPTRLGVLERRGAWLGVADPRLGNGRRGWVRVSPALRLTRTRMRLVIDVSARRLELHDGHRRVLRAPVAVGGPGVPTPEGVFTVTDKLAGTRFAASYGCCILALSAVQPHLAVGWTGGDRIAIHGTDNPASIGLATSNGCVRAEEWTMRQLVRRVPLGTPVRIRA